MKNKTGFAYFGILIFVVIAAIIAVVGYVTVSKKNLAPLDIPEGKALATPTPQTTQVEFDNSQTPSPVPTLSTSMDVEVIGREMDQTKVDSVDADFKAMNSSASSL